MRAAKSARESNGALSIVSVGVTLGVKVILGVELGVSVMVMLGVIVAVSVLVGVAVAVHVAGNVEAPLTPSVGALFATSTDGFCVWDESTGNSTRVGNP